MLETLKMDCPDSIGMGVRNESEWVSGMDWNHCPESIGMGVRNGAEYAKHLVDNCCCVVIVILHSYPIADTWQVNRGFNLKIEFPGKLSRDFPGLISDEV